MGFKAPARKLVTLKFAGEQAGLEVVVRAASQSALRAAARLVEMSEGPDITEADAEVILDLFDRFARSLVSWNVEDSETGEPIPATPEGIADLDDEFVLSIIMGWLTTVQHSGQGGTGVVAAAQDHAEREQLGADHLLASGLPVEPLPDVRPDAEPDVEPDAGRPAGVEASGRPDAPPDAEPDAGRPPDARPDAA